LRAVVRPATPVATLHRAGRSTTIAPPRILLCFGNSVKKGRQTFFAEKVHPGDLAGGFSDLEMTWLLCCAGGVIPIPTPVSGCH